MKSLPVGTVLAWLVILGLVVMTYLEQHQVSEQVRAGGDEVGVVLSGRIALGTKELSGDVKQANEQIQQLKTGPVRQRLLVAVLVAELDGRDKAREYLESVETLRAEHDRTLTKSEQRLADLLNRLYAPDEQAELTTEDGEWLEQHFRWLGRLAVSHRPGAPSEEGKSLRNSARWSVLLLMGMMVLGGVLAIIGVVLVIAFVGFWKQGEIAWQPGPEQPTGVLIESFALWFLLFRGLGSLNRSFLAIEPMLATSLVMLTSTLLALAWCLLRGYSWADLRHEVGLNPGRSVRSEILAGIGTYAAMLPLILLSVLLLNGAMNLFDRGGGGGAGADPFAPSQRPAHPVAQQILGDVWAVMAIYLGAVVVAPLVEEIAFRGLLQRHLRAGFSRLASGLAVGVIFAIIHPQGLAGVPALLAIAVPLSLVREWRGSLLGPMVAHALNNGAVATLMVVLVR